MGKLEQLSFNDNKPASIKRILIFSACIFAGALAILIAGFAYIYYITPADSHGGTVIKSLIFTFKPGQTAFEGKDKMVILCLGVDNNYTEKDIMYTKGARTDTIFLLSIDAAAEAVNVLSVPRDCYVQISEKYGMDKINAAYAIGGIKQAEETVSKWLDVRIDHYIILKVNATANMVNALGGLEIDVEKDMDYDDNWGHLHVHLKKGPQLLNGEQAVGYARFRHDEESDWGRIRRQQQVMNTLIKEMKKPSNVLRIQKIVTIIHESIDTDLTIPQLLDIARLYKDFDRGNMKTGVIKGDDGGDQGFSYIVPYENEKVALVRKLLLRDSSLPPSEVRVGVLNGTATHGLATQVADTLTKRGYKVTRIADADRNDYNSTQVIDHMNDRKLATSFEEFVGPMEYVGGDAAKPQSEEDITIIVGSNWLEWKAAQKKQNPDSSRTDATQSARRHKKVVTEEVQEIPYPPTDEQEPLVVQSKKPAGAALEPGEKPGQATPNAQIPPVITIPHAENSSPAPVITVKEPDISTPAAQPLPSEPAIEKAHGNGS
jgi:polyisoprenyl-teichoic acid--peptidoglycan teichoic acid transferase